MMNNDEKMSKVQSLKHDGAPAGYTQALALNNMAEVIKSKLNSDLNTYWILFQK